MSPEPGDGIPCTFEGCGMTFHAEIVSDPGPHNSPPGNTGWMQSHEDFNDEVPDHDHRIATDQARTIVASCAGYYPSEDRIAT
jgi:hypothetical protein